MKTYPASKIAEFCIFYASKHGYSINNLKLQGMLYFIQGSSLKYRGHPCFSDPIIKWNFGAVVEEVHNNLRRFGKNDFHIPKELMDDFGQCLACLDSDDQKFLTDFCEGLIKYDTSSFVRWVCKETSWQETDEYTEITQEVIRNHFSDLPKDKNTQEYIPCLN